jgi:ERCC4-type nuclease
MYFRSFVLAEYNLICLAGAAECQSVKTAAVETEVWAGFEVLHTTGIGHTVALFAELTAALQVLSCCSLCPTLEMWHFSRMHQMTRVAA